MGLVGIFSPNFFTPRDELWSTNEKVTARILMHPNCSYTVSWRICQVVFFRLIHQLPLLRVEFPITKLTFHSDLRRRKASRRALPCPSSIFLVRWQVTVRAFGTKLASVSEPAAETMLSHNSQKTTAFHRYSSCLHCDFFPVVRYSLFVIFDLLSTRNKTLSVIRWISTDRFTRTHWLNETWCATVVCSKIAFTYVHGAQMCRPKRFSCPLNAKGAENSIISLSWPTPPCAAVVCVMPGRGSWLARCRRKAWSEWMSE